MPAGWLARRLGAWGTVGGVAGTGFEAYARILHPVPVAGTANSSDRWTWQDVAARTGRVVHPLAQWDHVSGREERVFHDQDGVVRISPPRAGRLEPDLLAMLVPTLVEATTTPESIVIAVWNGWGDSGMLAGSAAPLPGRDYVLRTGALTELLDPDWPFDAQLGWYDWYKGAMPQLIWPDDHAWVVASEIDWDSTIIAGPRNLIDAIVTTIALETFHVTSDDSLMSDSDTVNAPIATE